MIEPDRRWPQPQRILLLTYDRWSHIDAIVEHGVVGVAGDRASVAKASRLRADDWVLLRLSDFEGFVAARPFRVTGRPFTQGPSSRFPDLLWEREVEEGRILYPYRIPVTADGGPATRPGCINWDSLAALGLRGKDGYRLEVPQQWGMKFKTSVLDAPADVQAMVGLVYRCAAA